MPRIMPAIQPARPPMMMSEKKPTPGVPMTARGSCIDGSPFFLLLRGALGLQPGEARDSLLRATARRRRRPVTPFGSTRRHKTRPSPCGVPINTRKTSRRTSRQTCSTATASRSGWGRRRTGLGHQNTGTARDPFTADEAIALLKRLDQDENKTAVAHGVLVPQPSRHCGVWRHRADAGPSLRLRFGAAHSRTADAGRGPVHQARMPAELRRRVGEDTRAAAADRGASALLLPAATHGRRPDRTRGRRSPGDQRLREHNRGLRLRSRGYARRPRRDPPEVA